MRINKAELRKRIEAAKPGEVIPATEEEMEYLSWRISPPPEHCAAGPWHRSSDTPPPKDGRWILARMDGEFFAIQFHNHAICPEEPEGWSIAKEGGVYRGCPDFWAEINIPEEK